MTLKINRDVSSNFKHISDVDIVCRRYDETTVMGGHRVEGPETQAKVLNTLKHLATRVNNFFYEGLGSATYLPLYCGTCQVGLISPVVLTQLVHYPGVFVVTNEQVTIHDRFTTEPDRSAALEEVLLDLKKKDVFPPLRGWRKECYEVRQSPYEPLLFRLERSAAPLFGVRQYGVHINGFVQHSQRGLCLWLQRRAANKQTWPNMLDNFVGGALAEGLGVLETAIKEAAEEANVSEELAMDLRPSGSVSFVHQSSRGIHNNTLFIYDLELPETFVPSNNDGEVSSWQLVSIDQVLDTISSPDFKVTSSPVALDWLIRHGGLAIDLEPHHLPELSRLPLNDQHTSVLLNTIDQAFNLDSLS